jgi:hypothetical protein
VLFILDLFFIDSLAGLKTIFNRTLIVLLPFSASMKSLILFLLLLYRLFVGFCVSSFFHDHLFFISEQLEYLPLILKIMTFLLQMAKVFSFPWSKDLGTLSVCRLVPFSAKGCVCVCVCVCILITSPLYILFSLFLKVFLVTC